ncbi:MAG TPA: hypothetical protein VHJ83_02275 [Micromonosporaceae bacterium]|jgi:hypothetical protein|nr:hypothetical protein [Micromonosporaceae bacterium]
MDPQRESSFGRLLVLGAMYCWITPVLVAVLGRSQLAAGLIGMAGLVGLALAAVRLPAVGDVEAFYQEDRWLALGTGLVVISPLVMLGYAVTGLVWALGAMIVAGTVALVIQFVLRGDYQRTEDRWE